MKNYILLLSCIGFSHIINTSGINWIEMIKNNSGKDLYIASTSWTRKGELLESNNTLKDTIITFNQYPVAGNVFVPETMLKTISTNVFFVLNGSHLAVKDLGLPWGDDGWILIWERGKEPKDGTLFKLREITSYDHIKKIEWFFKYEENPTVSDKNRTYFTLCEGLTCTRNFVLIIEPTKLTFETVKN